MHCKAARQTIFELWLHIFTDHLHRDMGLGQAESAAMLNSSRPYVPPMMWHKG